MAKKDQLPMSTMPSQASQPQHESSEWTSDDVPRLSLGEGVTKKGEPRVRQIVGRYLCSIIEQIKGRQTYLHRLALSAVDGKASSGEALVYGSGAINRRMVRLPDGCKVRLTYMGSIDTGEDTPMKDIRVEWPPGTKLRAAAPTPRHVADDDVPF